MAASAGLRRGAMLEKIPLTDVTACEMEMMTDMYTPNKKNSKIGNGFWVNSGIYIRGK